MRDGARRIDYAPSLLNPTPSRRYYFYLMLPAVIILACITIYPFFWLIYMSLHKVDIGGAGDVWNDFKNWSRLARDSKFQNGWWLLLKYSAMCMIMEVGLGVLLAVILNNSKREKLLVTIFLMPMMMAPIIAGLVWYYLYNGTFGWYHWLLQSVGILGETSILGSRDTAMIGIVIVDVWQWTPLNNADHPGRPETGAARSARGQHGGRRRAGAEFLPDIAAQSLPLPADCHSAALHGQLPLHRRDPGSDRRRTGQFHQDPADLSVRRVLPVLQAGPRRGDRPHPADRDHHSGPDPGQGLRQPRPARPGRPAEGPEPWPLPTSSSTARRPAGCWRS